MALPIWPASLPPLVAPTDVAGTDRLVPDVMQTTFDDGPDRVRRKRLGAADERNMSLRLTRAQFTTFRSFVRGPLNDGASRFSAMVRGPSGTLVPRVCRVNGPIAERDMGPFSTVSFKILVWDW